MHLHQKPQADRRLFTRDVSHEQRVSAVSAVHAHIDEQTERFAQQSKVRCPDGCGACCHSPHVEATVADLLPLASELVRTGKASQVLQQLDEQRDGPRCVLFAADVQNPTRGRCTVYGLRPSICRLFGFAGRRDADGKPQFTACRVHTQQMPDTVAAAREAVASGSIALPILSDLASQVTAVSPGESGVPQPINEALREAIHRVALRAMLADDDSDDDDTTPRMPPREAA